MKTVEYTSRRVLATTPEEKAIIKSWGSLWSRFVVLERSGKPIVLIFGDWSGYRSAQYRITHVDFAGHYNISDDFRGTVQFSDNTTMNVWCRVVTREQILSQKYENRKSYTDLIKKLIASGQSFYKV